jgi:hypothetical protein
LKDLENNQHSTEKELIKMFRPSKHCRKRNREENREKSWKRNIAGRESKSSKR